MNENEIEYLNALAPFDHGVWEGAISTGEKVSVGGALFSNRSEWLVDKVVSYLIDEFTLKTLETMSLLEVGSYDGWVLTQICNRIKFLDAIGVEPRKKNIKKGEVGRKLAGIETQAHFIQGSADDVRSLFPDRDFDIVICLGVLHHVSSTYDTILSISSKSSNFEPPAEISDFRGYFGSQTLLLWVSTWPVNFFGTVLSENSGPTDFLL